MGMYLLSYCLQMRGLNFFLIGYVSIEGMHIYFYDDTDQTVFSFLLIYVPH